MKVKTFSGPMMEFIHDLLDFFFRDRLVIATCGRILAYQSMHILICASLPGSIGGCKIKFDPQFFGNLLMSGKSLAVVCCNRMDTPDYRLKQVDQRLADLFGSALQVPEVDPKIAY